MISSLWTRFVPHFTTGRDVEGRIIGIPDEGANIPLGQCTLKALPAHFLHAEGNFQFYDPVSKILFCGQYSTIKGFAEYIAADVSLPVTIANPWHNCISLHETIPELPHDDAVRYTTVIGLSLTDHHYE